MNIIPKPGDAIYSRPCSDELMKNFTQVCEILRTTQAGVHEAKDYKITVEDRAYDKNRDCILDTGELYENISEIEVSLQDTGFRYLLITGKNVQPVFALFFSNSFLELAGQISVKLYGDFIGDKFPIHKHILELNFDKLFGLDGTLSSLDEFAALFRSAGELN